MVYLASQDDVTLVSRAPDGGLARLGLAVRAPDADVRPTLTIRPSDTNCTLNTPPGAALTYARSHVFKACLE